MDTTIQHLADETYAEAADQPGLLVIDFWAGWRGPCRAMAPQFEKADELVASQAGVIAAERPSKHSTGSPPRRPVAPRLTERRRDERQPSLAA